MRRRRICHQRNEAGNRDGFATVRPEAGDGWRDQTGSEGDFTAWGEVIDEGEMYLERHIIMRLYSTCFLLKQDIAVMLTELYYNIVCIDANVVVQAYNGFSCHYF